jgi:hypothetical protein
LISAVTAVPGPGRCEATPAVSVMVPSAGSRGAGGAGGPQLAQQLDADGALDRRRVEVRHAPTSRLVGGHHEVVQRVEPVDQRRDRRRVGDVDGGGAGTVAEALGGRAGTRLVASGDRDGGAALEGAGRDGSADAGRAADDEDVAAGERGGGHGRSFRAVG